MEAGIHSREYSTNEVLTRFAEQLVANYGIDPDTTWLLDYFQLDLNPVVNPDGRKFAEQGYLWRKNTNPNPPDGSAPADFPNYGVDLNRNHTFEWGTVDGGSSGDPSSEVYRGNVAASEPETQAVENFVATLYPGRQGATRTKGASDDSTGLLIDLHSFGNTVLYPWGSTSDPAPNRDGLRNLGLKFGYYANANGTPYDVYQAIGLYPTDGTTDDWAYGTFWHPWLYLGNWAQISLKPATTLRNRSRLRSFRLCFMRLNQSIALTKLGVRLSRSRCLPIWLKWYLAQSIRLS